MKRPYLLYYGLMILLNLLPVLPLSLKGILGMIFIIISCLQFGYKDGMYTATLWAIFAYGSFILDINVDYKFRVISMLLGSALYYLTAYYLGSTVSKLKRTNGELKGEILSRKSIEKELNEKLMFIQSLINTIPSPMFFTDMDGRYIECNHAFESCIGISESDLKNKNVYDIFDEELARGYHDKDRELLNGKGVQTYESAMSFADGSLRDVIINEALFKDNSGNPIGIVGIITDITDKKESELLRQSLAEKKHFIDEIVEHDKMKTEFFANISHELRTPLNVILGSMQLIEMYSKDNTYSECQEKVIRNISIMKQNCYRLLRLVNNLIDITKIDACAFEIQLKNCDIVNIIEEITLSVSEYVQSKGISLKFDTDVEEKVIACDEEKIERILLNLLSNAVKFTPKGGSINVNICDRADSLYIMVRDNGIGIPKSKQGDIFKRFCQIDNILSRQHEGSGIGLNLVKSLVEMHGGEITVESEPGEGTVFIINLPLRTVIEEENVLKPHVKHDYAERVHIEFSDVYSVCS